VFAKKTLLPSPEEFEHAALVRVLHQLAHELRRIRAAARRGYKDPTRSLEHELEDDLDVLEDDLNEEEEED
jgi:hypothetical protein